MKWSKSEKEFVAAARVARVATASPEGMPHNVPVCPLFDGGKIYFGTEPEGRKMENLQANPRAAVVFDDYTDAWSHLRGILLQGTARIVDKKTFRAIRKKLYAKYQQYERNAALEEDESVIVEVTPRHKFSWGL